MACLVSSKKIGSNVEKNKTEREYDTYGQTPGFLAFATHPDETKTNLIELHDDRHWLRISTL